MRAEELARLGSTPDAGLLGPITTSTVTPGRCARCSCAVRQIVEMTGTSSVRTATGSESARGFALIADRHCGRVGGALAAVAATPADGVSRAAVSRQLSFRLNQKFQTVTIAMAMKFAT